MIMIAPRSSMIAKAVRKIFNEAGTLLPSNESIAKENAISHHLSKTLSVLRKCRCAKGVNKIVRRESSPVQEKLSYREGEVVLRIFHFQKSQ